MLKRVQTSTKPGVVGEITFVNLPTYNMIGNPDANGIVDCEVPDTWFDGDIFNEDRFFAMYPHLSQKEFKVPFID